MVPLSTHQQLLAEKFQDPEFRESLDAALAGGVKRVSRLLNQMRFLAREGQVHTEVFGVEKLIEDAYEDATQQQPIEGAQLKFENSGQPLVVSGDRAALKHALSEIMLNALQANPQRPQIGVKLQSAGGAGNHALTIEVQDNGGGFTAEAARRVPSPFYTTRNVGLGLGLAVSQKIIETHHGKLEIVPSPSGLVRVSLPAESALAVGV
jgi:two-component system sensor kinase FixL